MSGACDAPEHAVLGAEIYGGRPAPAEGRMGGVNEALQLAAALDRRGISVSLDQTGVMVRIDRDVRPMLIRSPRPPAWQWTWSYNDKDGAYPDKNYEEAAEVVEKFLRSIPLLAGTELLYRMDHMGMSWEQESQEALERAGRKQNPRENSKAGPRFTLG